MDKKKQKKKKKDKKKKERKKVNGKTVISAGTEEGIKRF